MYRGSSNSTDSISTVLAIVRFAISTILPKFLAIVRFFRDFCGKSGLWKLIFTILLQSSISTVFPIVRFPFAPTSVLLEDPLYLKFFNIVTALSFFQFPSHRISSLQFLRQQYWCSKSWDFYDWLFLFSVQWN